MQMETIAIVGAGKGGTAILEMLLKMPAVTVKHICDINPAAPGLALAAQHNIHSHPQLDGICQDTEVDLIIEVTGRKEIFARILALKHANTRVIGSDDARIIFHLLDIQQDISLRLEETNQILERRVLERTMELEKANTDLEKKIIEHEKLNEKLRQINNEKTKYLMTATHQLKAPFAAIQAYADLILDGYAGKTPAATLDIIRKIRARCSLLTESIKDMLELANLKSLVKENIKFEACSLDTIIASCCNHLEQLAAARKIKVACQVEPDISVKCNRNQILILLSNLLENAIYYSSPGTTVSITAMKGPGSLARISVIDRGIGIDEKFHSRIFEEYFRSNDAVEINEIGNGLGLAIAREIALIHDSAIEVESAPGKGSRFSFHLKQVTNPSS